MPVIDRWLVDATVIDTLSIGAGGGSIARVNELIANRVEVGPESAGSMPGPAAYNQGGTEPTVTDADVVLGYINPDYFHGGAIKLDKGRAERAIREKVAKPLGIPVEEAAYMIKRIVDGNMGQAIWRETVLKGFDPREFILFAFGGAGPTHCCGYAHAAEMNMVVIFPFAPVFCAFGSSTMDIVHMYERSRHLHVLHPATHEYMKGEDYEIFNDTMAALHDLARRDFIGEGYDEDEVEYTLELDMKFGGQLNVKRATCPVLRIESEEDVVKIRQAFEEEYAQAYSSLGLNPEAGIDIHNFVLRGRVAQPKPELPRYEPVSADASAAQAGSRHAYWGPEIGWVDTPVFRQNLLQCGNVIEGPAVIEAEDTTVVIEPKWKFSLGEYMDGIMEFTHSGAEVAPDQKATVSTI
jgi:N-methylhydantoinase A/acetophenone carboxylase